MSDEEPPANKRRRLLILGVDQVVPLPIDITDLPYDALHYIFSFIGKGHFRFISGTNRQFQNAYSITKEEEHAAMLSSALFDFYGTKTDCSIIDKQAETAKRFERKTTWEVAASSASCAQLCLEDLNLNEMTEEEKKRYKSLFDCTYSEYAIKEIALKAAKFGHIDVLQWALTNGFELMPGHGSRDEYIFEVAAKHGQVHVLEWANGLHLDWYSNVSLEFAAGTGNISVFQSAYEEGRDLAARQDFEVHHRVQRIAIHNEQLGVLTWLKDHDWIEPSGYYIWIFAALYGSINVLNWAVENEYPLDPNSVARNAVTFDSLNALDWARKHGARWKEKYCVKTAYWGYLRMLQWLRENGCPWNSSVIRYAQRHGHEHVVTWARANGCPEP